MNIKEKHIVISRKDPSLLMSYEAVIAEIHVSLVTLKYLAARTDFSNMEQRTRYADNIIALKCFYERAERLVM